ncbi:NRDE-2, necessary for RNA interference-domain-containing protein [Biscogniauxia marginata]|nr:NRDE-2, necessary for RNA interference-domain-containing protein [Biscogniauxia marginata]
MSSHREGKRPAIPKFSSFKPKPKPAEPEIVLGRVESDNGNESRRTEDGEHQIAHRSRDRHRSSIDTSHKLDTRHIRPPWQSSAQDPPRNDVYIIDKRGDALIRRYGSNNRHDVPAYRRIGAGRLLGVAGFMSVDRSGNHEEFFIRGHGEGSSLLSSDRKSLLAKGIRLKSQPVRIRQEPSQATGGTEDYLPLRRSRKRKRDGLASGESSGEEGPSYRSIHGKSKSHEHSDSDELYASDSSVDAMGRGIDDPVNLKTVELSRRVREHPDDIASWFELVDHQDTLLQLNQSGDGRPTAAETKSYADIKLSMLEQALSHAKGDSQRERLHLRIMREGAKIWDLQTTSKRWENTVQKYPTSFEVWREYMNFRQSLLPSFRFEEIKQLYIDRLRYLSKEISGLSPASDHIQLYEHMIYVFLRLMRFVSDAGYAELATAAWQATLELNFVRPTKFVNSTEGEALSNFQEFWESEVPRLGEDQAQGWAAFETNGGAQEPAEPKTSSATIPLPTTRDGYKAWSTVEQYRTRKATIPARTLDDEEEDDPFRVIMFTDIQDIFLFLPAEIIPRVRHHLLDAFLIFCQLPPGFRSGSLANEMIQDSFLTRSAKTNLATHPFPKHDTVLAHEDLITRLPDFSHDYQRMNNTPEVLFPSFHWFRYMPPIRDAIPSEQYMWISSTLKQLTRTFGIKELAPYYLAFESINEPGNEKKSAKVLLKQDPANVDLYIGYSILERERGNKAAARNVVSAAMGLSTISSRDRLRLGIASAEIELRDGELAKSTVQLCALVEESPQAASILESTEASSAQILKARQLLASNQDYLVSSGDLANAILYAEGLTLLEYLTCRSGREPCSAGQGDIWSATSSIMNCSSDLVSRGCGSAPEHENLLQFAARLLYYHATHGPFRSGFLREQLAQYIKYFPNNTIFLYLFAWREERLSIDDRVRSLLSNVVLAEPHVCVSSHIFAIRHELQTGNAHSTRAAFEHSLAHESCMNHPGLWVAYIRFCHGRKELRSKAKDVFYRAIQCCPWSKDVFMEAFATLVRDMDSSELKSVYNTLSDKGLRVHVEMEEFVEKWRSEWKEKIDKR